MEDGSCLAAGVPPSDCAEGFVHQGDGCEPILPPAPCNLGEMVIPGETRCRPVAACASVPTDPGVVFVDVAYRGGMSDGTAAHPWTTIQAGIDAAPSGGTIAVSAGTYAESLVIDHGINVAGVCPEQVVLVGAGSVPVALMLGSGSALRSLSIQANNGAAPAVAVAAPDVTLDRVWIHDTSSVGVYVTDDLGPAGARLTNSLLEQVGDIGAAARSAELVIEGSVIRNTLSGATSQPGGGVDITLNQGSTARARLSMVRSVIEGTHYVGVFVGSSDADIDASVIRETQPRATDLTEGMAIAVEHRGQRASLTLRGSVITDNHTAGLHLHASDATLERSVIRRTWPNAADKGGGEAVAAQDDPTLGERSVLTLRSSVLAEIPTPASS